MYYRLGEMCMYFCQPYAWYVYTCVTIDAIDSVYR